MTEQACPDCGHNRYTVHDAQGCTLETCDCTTPTPTKEADE